MQLTFIKINYSLKLFMLILVLSLMNSCKKDDHWPPPATEESATVLYDWYRLAVRMQLHTSPPPSVIANCRSFGYIGVGVYEAVQPGIKGAVSLSGKLYQMPDMPSPEAHQDYSWSASANAVLASLFRQMLIGLTDANRASIDSLENAYNERFRLSASDAVISRSQAFGRAVATTIYNWSTSDNFNLSADGYVLPVGPSAWVPTPPAFAPPVGPFLENSRPFLQSNLTAIIAPPPVSFSEEKSSDFFKAVKEVYEVGNKLTDEQKATARFWADAGGVGVGFPGPGHALRVITNLQEDKGVALGKAAEVYAKTGIAMKDAFIIGWRAKFQYNLLRPITYIHRHIDPDWSSYLPNPPYPEYPSGLAGIVTPVMQVLIREFGDIPITDDTYASPGTPPRHYDSISELIDEAAISRLYAGIHYRFTQVATVKYGKELGNRIADIKLTGFKH